MVLYNRAFPHQGSFYLSQFKDSFAVFFSSDNILYICKQRLRTSVNTYIFIANAYAHIQCRSKRLRVTLHIKPNAKYIAVAKPQQNPFFIGQCSWHGIGRNNFLLINLMKISLHRSHRAIILTSEMHLKWSCILFFISCFRYSTALRRKREDKML